MNVISTPINVEPVAITFTQQHASNSVVTTLYDLIASIQDVVDTDDNALVVATLRHILETGTAWRPL